MDSALKTAKKLLKKKNGDSIKLKTLAKEVVQKIKDENVSVDDVKKWIAGSDKFCVEKKHVSLKKSSKKRKHEVEKDGETDMKSNDSKRTKQEKKLDYTSKDISVSEALAWRTDNKVVLKETLDDQEGEEDGTKKLNNSEAYMPYSTFSSTRCKEAVHEALIRQCTEVNGFKKPSAIQAQCWPVLLNPGSDGKRRDAVGIAETGSGKTLAFSVPALTALAKDNSNLPTHKRRTPRMLVLAPTRELAMQSHVVLDEFGSLLNLTSLVVYGGVPKHSQKDAFRKGVDIVVATPGRIKDLINEGACVLNKVTQLVLDEADRMLDMGFEEDVRFIISQCKGKTEGRQTAMFSATWPAAIQKIALEYMVNPVRIYVGFEAIVGSNGENAMDDSLSANKRVSQTVEVIDDRAREGRLRSLLSKYGNKSSKKNPYRILIFALYKKEAARLEMSLKRQGWDVSSIHGDKTQEARTKALESFKAGETPMLVATDVAARGLDIPNVELVINYTFPLTIEDYVHRIGRTGRAGKTGISYTFFQPSDKGHAGELQQVMKQAGQSVPEALMKFGSTIKKKEHKLYGNFGPQGGGPMKKAVKITFDSDVE